MVDVDINDDIDDDFDADQFRKSNRMVPAVRNKIDKVPLPQVRKQLFELLRYQFGFENASFARNRMLAALKTASFAVTSGTEFRKKLYQLHVDHINSESIAGWINTLCGILWPNGVFFESSRGSSALFPGGLILFQCQAVLGEDDLDIILHFIVQVGHRAGVEPILGSLILIVRTPS